MAQLRQRSRKESVEETGEVGAPRADSPLTATSPFSGIAGGGTLRPAPDPSAVNYPDPGGGGGGTSTSPREMGPSIGGAGTRTLTTSPTPSPAGGRAVGLRQPTPAASPVPPPAMPQGMGGLPPLPMAPTSSPQAPFPISRSSELFGGGDGGGLFGRAGGLAGGGLGVPGVSSSAQGQIPSNLIQALLRLFGGQ